MDRWLSVNDSEILPKIRGQGEGQELEFMREFPRNARELGKEIAAFASTNDGTILIGVADSGELVGVDGLGDPEARDKLIQRIEGICHGPIKPSLTPKVSFALEDDRTVVFVTVSKGADPVYYYEHVPYVRHLTEARPATPNEVIERVASSLRSHAQPDQRLDFLESLGSQLGNILVWSTHYEGHVRSGGVGELQSMFSFFGDSLRALAADGEAVGLGVAGELEDLAEQCDGVAHHRLPMGRESFEELRSKVDDAEKSAIHIRVEHVHLLIQPEDVIGSAVEVLDREQRALESLGRRADSMVRAGDFASLANKAGSIGLTLAMEFPWFGGHRGSRILDLRRRCHESSDLHA